MKKHFLILIFCITGLSVLSANQLFPTDKPLVLILLGPPGAGKGTQAVSLSKELEIPHISAGDLFRENIRNKTPLGKKANNHVRV